MRILFVDGEPGAAQALAGRVASEGFAECFAATGAEEAVDLVNREGAIDLLVADVFMEGIDGITLSETLRAHLPDLRVIFLSEVDVSEHADRIGEAPVFGKPVDPDALAAYLRNGATAPAENPQFIGAFRLDALLGTDASGPVYDAFQTSISRQVHLHTLDPSLFAPERFLADASLKANVRHPAVLAVFEAGEADGTYFYAAEPPQGVPLSSAAAEGRQLPAADVLQLLQTVAEAMVHFSEAGISREPLGPEQILIDHRNRVRIQNIASSQPVQFSAAEELRELSRTLSTMLERTGQIGPLLQLLDEMGVEDGGVRTWLALLHEVKRRAPQSAPTRQIALDASGRAAIAAVGASRKRQRALAFLKWVVIFVVLLAAAGGAVWYFAVPFGGKIPSVMTAIPAGAVDYENGKHVDVPAFWIDRNEVSIAEYAEFLAWLKRPQDVSQIVHPGMPSGKSHVPDGWEGSDGIYETAKKGGIWNGRRIDLSAPVTNVDWFDAYAFSRWKGRRLPVEEEWDRITLGEEGKPPAEAAEVKALDGGVAEWTNTWLETPDGKQMPIVRGGTSSALDARRRVSNLGPLERSPDIGFRTASQTAPQR